MFSLKTKDVPPKRTFLILFSILGISALALSAHSLIASSNREALIKDDSTILPRAEGINSEPVVEEVLASDDKPLITTYTVVRGDTLSTIAEKFDISTNTIRWANDLTAKSAIHVGDKLTILPVTGIQYTVKKGDTISAIALKFDVSQAEILDFNDIEGSKIVPGAELIIPEGEPITPPKPVAKPVPVVKKAEPVSTVKKEVEIKTETTTKTETAVVANKTTSSDDYFIAPLPGSRLSQGLHDKTAVDMAIKVGSTVLAAASGVVSVIKDSNVWNGGYGYYLMIKHDNGTETLYAHLSRIDVEVGQKVEQGEAIALSGKTGRVTGPHLHFEVRGATNPFAKDKYGTTY